MCSYGLTNSYFFYEFIMIYWLPAFKVLNIWIFYGYSMGYSMDILCVLRKNMIKPRFVVYFAVKHTFHRAIRHQQWQEGADGVSVWTMTEKVIA